ncbi:uncharacterized protein LOC105844417 isoform X2 [Hydra vulgaris]|uniref:uncharacterized protein LOC105844417 isoform X2 n=1 Tax=Hydra vulgaris TaxID=6087 RepID=UPI001F5F0166|nr:uncharacterized protein LOC105844417 isoform X2 [Hydra vulgaris]
MNQIVEGLDNDVLFIVFFLILIIILIPFYIFSPIQSRLSSFRNQERAEFSHNFEQSNNQNNGSSTFVSPGINDSDIHTSASLSNSEIDLTQDNISQKKDTVASDDVISIKVINNEVFHIHTVSKFMKLSDLKRKCFPVEYDSAKNIRFIYRGCILSVDSSTLNDLNIIDGSVIHCVISDQASSYQRQSRESSTPADFDLSGIFIPLLSMIIVLIWITVFMYSYLFSGIKVLTILSQSTTEEHLTRKVTPPSNVAYRVEPILR